METASPSQERSIPSSRASRTLTTSCSPTRASRLPRVRHGRSRRSPRGQRYADGPASLVPRAFWRFGKIEDDGSYVPDPNYICSERKFEKGRLYQLVHTTVGAPVRGLSFAALRDCVSWFKHGSANSESPIPISYAYAYGRSQTGRFLRTFIYNDLNRDEEGRDALDGIIANVAGGMRGEFNQRFGQNSKDRNNMLTQLFPFAASPRPIPRQG